MFGMPKVPLGMLSVAGLEPNVRNNDQEQMTALQKLYAATQATNRTPQGRIDRGFSAFGPAGQMPQPTEPMLPTPPTPAPVDMGQPAAPQAPVPPALSQGGWQGPHSVGGAPISMGPISVGGAPLGASGATGYQGLQMTPFDPPASQASGPDVIQKLMSYFHNKGDPSST